MGSKTSLLFAVLSRLPALEKSLHTMLAHNVVAPPHIHVAHTFNLLLLFLPPRLVLGKESFVVASSAAKHGEGRPLGQQGRRNTEHL